MNLRLAQEPDGAFENTLYNIMRSAAGDDGILQEKELEKVYPDRIAELNMYSRNVIIANSLILFDKK